MSFRQHFHRWQRHQNEHAAWRLLSADNAPLILAFVQDVFSSEAEVPFSRAKLVLETELAAWGDDAGLLGNSVTYLRQWIAAGWLREQDERLTQTDACEQALRFVQSLEQREMTSTASRLRIVQEEVRDLSIALSPNIEERITLLQSKRAQIDREIESLRLGFIEKLSADHKRERIRNLYSMARDLTGDFRQLEDEIRNLDKALRVKMIDSAEGRGEVVEAFLSKQSLLSSTDAGRAFDGFFQMLCDPNRNSEFREQLNSILRHDSEGFLKPQERRFLNHLVRELSREGDRILEVRRRTQESLRGYIEHNDLSEMEVVGNCLRELERLAINFREQRINLNSKTGLRLRSGRFLAASPALQLTHPETRISLGAVVAHENGTAPSDNMLSQMHTVRVREVAKQLRALVHEHGPMSIAQIMSYRPVHNGLEELVAYIRVAKATTAVSLAGSEENVMISDRSGSALRVRIPSLILGAAGFPDNIEELPL